MKIKNFTQFINEQQGLEPVGMLIDKIERLFNIRLKLCDSGHAGEDTFDGSPYDDYLDNLPAGTPIYVYSVSTADNKPIIHKDSQEEWSAYVIYNQFCFVDDPMAVPLSLKNGVAEYGANVGTCMMSYNELRKLGNIDIVNILENIEGGMQIPLK